MENTKPNGGKIKKERRIKKQHRYKGLKKNSNNYKVFSILAYLLSKAAKTASEDIKDILDLIGEYTMGSLAQKFHGTYYSNLEKSMPTQKEIRQAEIKKAIKELELYNYIKIKKDKQNKTKLKISLTKKGAQEYLRYKIDKKKNQKWDRKWRIVIFDIWESQKRIRDLLRAKLKWMGFKELQKSVWVFPYNVEKEIREILDLCHLDIIGDVRFLTVEKMSDDEDLRAEFGFSNSTNLTELTNL